MDALQLANTAFAVDMFKKLCDTDKTANIIFAPLCTSTSLALAYKATKGDTADQMKQVRHWHPALWLQNYVADEDGFLIILATVVQKQAANCPLEIPEWFHTVWSHTTKKVENHWGKEKGFLKHVQGGKGHGRVLNRCVKALTPFNTLLIEAAGHCQDHYICWIIFFFCYYSERLKLNRVGSNFAITKHSQLPCL